MLLPLFKLLFWLFSELSLSLIGLDTIADYSEYLFHPYIALVMILEYRAGLPEHRWEE